MYVSKEFLHQILAASPVFLGDFIAGFGYGWVAPTLHLLNNDEGDFSLTKEQSSWIASLHDFGRLIGTLVVSQVLNFVGRNSVIAVSSLTFLITWILIISTRSVAIIYVARMIFGLAVGLFDVTCAIYLCENFKPHYRCAFGSITVACFFGGYLIEFCLVNYLSYDAVAYTNCAVALLALLSNLFAKESAEYLIPRNKEEQAWKNFRWLRGETQVNAELVREFEVLKEHIENESKRKKTMASYLGVPVYRKGITMVVVLGSLTVATGFPALSSFVSMTFRKSTLTENEFTMLYGGILFVSIVFGSTVIEKINRRTVLIISLLIAAIVHATSAVLFYLWVIGVRVDHFSWFIFATITIYSMMYSAAVLPVFCAARGELLPQHVRPFGGALAVMGHSLIGFLSSKAFLYVDKTFGMHWNFAFYSFMSLASVVFVYFILPETRGKTLIEIQNTMELESRRK